jgi:hypothetical protein
MARQAPDLVCRLEGLVGVEEVDRGHQDRVGHVAGAVEELLDTVVVLRVECLHHGVAGAVARGDQKLRQARAHLFALLGDAEAAGRRRGRRLLRHGTALGAPAGEAAVEQVQVAGRHAAVVQVVEEPRGHVVAALVVHDDGPARADPPGLDALLHRGLRGLARAVAVQVGADRAGDVPGQVLRGHRGVEHQHLGQVLLQPGRVDQAAGAAGLPGLRRCRGQHREDPGHEDQQGPTALKESKGRSRGSLTPSGGMARSDRSGGAHQPMWLGDFAHTPAGGGRPGRPGGIQ